MIPKAWQESAAHGTVDFRQMEGVMATQDSRRASVTARALSILDGFDESHRRRTLTELARHADLPLSTAHRLLAELEALQMLEREPDGAYVIGRKLWQLGTLAPVQRELRDVAIPAMQDLYEATHENVHLAIRQGLSALYIERIHGKRSVGVATRVGRPLPLHATSVGKVLLAYADDEIRAQVLRDLKPVTRYTMIERGRVLRELAGVRRNAYAKSYEEMTLGTSAIAVPVFAATGEVLAALGLVTSSARRDLIRFVPALVVAAATITRALPG